VHRRTLPDGGIQAPKFHLLTRHNQAVTITAAIAITAKTAFVMGIYREITSHRYARSALPLLGVSETKRGRRELWQQNKIQYGHGDL